MSTRKKAGSDGSAKLMMIEVKPGEPLRFDEAESLSAWIRLYGALEAASNAENTEAAKGRDLELFMTFFREKLNSDHPDGWTKSITTAFLRHLESGQGKKATTVIQVRLFLPRGGEAALSSPNQSLVENLRRVMQEGLSGGDNGTAASTTAASKQEVLEAEKEEDVFEDSVEESVTHMAEASS
jgi:hypothetical protein